jgi:hypothetical protein
VDGAPVARVYLERLANDIAKGLQFIHELRIVHILAAMTASKFLWGKVRPAFFPSLIRDWSASVIPVMRKH